MRTGESVVPEPEDEMEEGEGRTVVLTQRPGERRRRLGGLAQLRVNPRAFDDGGKALNSFWRGKAEEKRTGVRQLPRKAAAS